MILSTGIAETALTIDDVMFVIDSGRIEERVYDAKAGNYLIDRPQLLLCITGNKLIVLP